MNSLDRYLSGEIRDLTAVDVQPLSARIANFGEINCYMVCPPKSDDNYFVLARTDPEARLIFYKETKKIPYEVTLVLENAAMLDARPRVVTSYQEVFALGCQFTQRTISKDGQ